VLRTTFGYWRGIEREKIELLVPLLFETLVEVVVLPVAGDAEVLRSCADVGEAVAGEDALPGGVVRQGGSLDTVQFQIFEAEPHGRRDRRGGDPTSVIASATQ
jgi:hypothetical protein